MSTTELATAVKALPFAERTEFLDRMMIDLMHDVPVEILEAQTREVQRRREEYLAGKVQLIPGEQVWREIDELLNDISRVPPGSSR